MSKKMAIILMGYGLLLGVWGLATRSIEQVQGTMALIVGLTGGGLCALWGGLTLAGAHTRRTPTVVTLSAAVLGLVIETVNAWLPGADKTRSTAGVLLATLMLLLTAGMLMYVLHGERPAEFYNAKAVRRNGSAARAKETDANGE